MSFEWPWELASCASIHRMAPRLLIGSCAKYEKTHPDDLCSFDFLARSSGGDHQSATVAHHSSLGRRKAHHGAARRWQRLDLGKRCGRQTRRQPVLLKL